MRCVDLHDGCVLLHDVVGWFVCQRSRYRMRPELRHVFTRRLDVLDEQRLLFAKLQRKRNVRRAMWRERFGVHERLGVLLGRVQQQHLRRPGLRARWKTLCHPQ
jgi:hypothetical protein